MKVSPLFLPRDVWQGVAVVIIVTMQNYLGSVSFGRLDLGDRVLFGITIVDFTPNALAA
jgi:hypothetical protein